MAKQPEARLQRRIRDQLEEHIGGFWFKVWGGPFQQAGIPDLIGCVQGLFFAFEVKTRKGKASAIQQETIKRIGERGKGCTAVVRTSSAAIALVRERLAEAGLTPEARGAVHPKKKVGLRAVQAGHGEDMDRPIGLGKPRGLARRDIPRVARGAVDEPRKLVGKKHSGRTARSAGH